MKKLIIGKYWNMWKQAKHVYVNQNYLHPDLSWKVNVYPKIYNKNKKK